MVSIIYLLTILLEIKVLKVWFGDWILEFYIEGDKLDCPFDTNELKHCAEQIQNLSEGSRCVLVLEPCFITITCVQVEVNSFLKCYDVFVHNLN